MIETGLLTNLSTNTKGVLKDYALLVENFMVERWWTIVPSQML